MFAVLILAYLAVKAKDPLLRAIIAFVAIFSALESSFLVWNSTTSTWAISPFDVMALVVGLSAYIADSIILQFRGE
jgi:hypothetical protein